MKGDKTMSNIFRNSSNNTAIQDIEEAIDNASDEICLQVNFDDFDPWARVYIPHQSSQDFCRQFFDGEIGDIRNQIFKNQRVPELVSTAIYRQRKIISKTKVC